MTTVLLRRQGLGRTSVREISRFSQTGIIPLRNDERFPDDTDLVFRWGCTSNAPTRNIVNTAAAIHRVSDKTGFRRLLHDHGGDQYVQLAPTTYFSPDDLTYPLRAPVIVRRSPHSQGRHLHLCNDEAAVRAACGRYSSFYISEVVNKVAEYRVAFVQGRACWVARKTPGNPDDIAWNVAQGGRFDNVRWDEWPLRVVRVAREAFMLSDLDFGGVDAMVAPDGTAYVIEINSAPSQTSPYRQECMSKCFDYIVRNGKATIPIISERGGYLKFIHPALSERALL